MGNNETLREHNLRFEAWMSAIESDMRIPMAGVNVRKNKNL